VAAAAAAAAAAQKAARPPLSTCVIPGAAVNAEGGCSTYPWCKTPRDWRRITQMATIVPD